MDDLTLPADPIAHRDGSRITRSSTLFEAASVVT